MWGCEAAAAHLEGKQLRAAADHLRVPGYAGVTGGPLGLALVDFQLVRENPGEWDVAYMVIESLTAEVRRANEMQLLSAYQTALVSTAADAGQGAAGAAVPASYSLLECMSAYQASILTLWPLQIILVATGTLAEESGQRLMRLMNERLCAAMDDWQCGVWLDARLAHTTDGGKTYPALTRKQMQSVLPAAALDHLSLYGEAQVGRGCCRPKL
jgi:hypothetical protein